jgi:hypothetical protein
MSQKENTLFTAKVIKKTKIKGERDGKARAKET